MGDFDVSGRKKRQRMGCNEGDRRLGAVVEKDHDDNKKPASQHRHAGRDVVGRGLEEDPQRHDESERNSEVSSRPSSSTATKRPGEELFCGTCASIRDFEKVGRLGEGTYGIVYLARDRRRRRQVERSEEDRMNMDQQQQQQFPLVALKRCIPHHESTEGFPVTALREMAALRACKHHPHVVQLETVAVSKSGVFLVLEHCDHDLAKVLDDNYRISRSSPFSVAAAKSLMVDLLSALQHCHDRHLLHRDVKPSNLLYTRHGTLKLADFGMSRFVSSNLEGSSTPHPPLTLTVASLWYRPPELLMGAESYTSSIDMWACGCFLTEILLGRPILNGRTDHQQLQLILQHLGPWPSDLVHPKSHDMLQSLPTTARHGNSKKLLDVFQDLSLEGLRLLTGLLHYDPRHRLSAARAIASPFLIGEDSPEPLSRDQMPTFRPPFGQVS